MGAARFKVMGRLDLAGGVTSGTVKIERESGLFIVRPLHRRRTFVMPLDMVATMVCQRIVLNEVMEEKAAKKKAKKR